MYILKTKGTKSIADFVQIRDNDFALIAHFKVSEIEKKIYELGFENPEKIIDFIKKAEYEKILKLP